MARPGPITGFKVEATGATTALASWNRIPTGGSTVTSIVLFNIGHPSNHPSPASSGGFVTQTSIEITGLVVGTFYRMVMQLRSNEGNISSSVVNYQHTFVRSSTPDKMAVPTLYLFVAAYLRVRFITPADNGSEITGYEIEREELDSNANWSHKATSLVSKLLNSFADYTNAPGGLRIGIAVRAS